MTGSYQGMAPAASRVDVMGGAPLAPDRLSMSPLTLSSIANAGTRVKPNFFGEGGTGRKIAGYVGDVLYGLGGGNVAELHASMARNALAQQQGDLDTQLKRLQIASLQRKAGQPDIEHIGDALGIVNPDTGGFTPTYTAPTDAERYAMASGASRGSPDWMKALQDFTLRGRGPTAAGFADDLEDERQDNRVQLEGLRQSGRVALRSVPTFGQAHPHVPGGVISGGFVGGRNSPAAGVSTADLLKQLGG